MTAATQPEQVFFSFDKPLKPEAEKTLRLLKERYVEQDGSPLVVFETDSLVTLRVPFQGVKRKSYSDVEVPSQA